MKSHPIRTLLIKLACVSGPFVIFFALVVLYVPDVASTQQAEAEDKIQKLILDASTSPQVIIDGDSRAEANVIPDVFFKETDLQAVNIGAGDVTLQQAYDTLSIKKVLNDKHLMLLSVSIFDINDRQGHQQLSDKVIIDNEPFGYRKIQDLLTYYTINASWLFNYAKDLMRFDQSDFTHMSPSLIQTKGYRSWGTAFLTPPRDGSAPDPDPLGWYADLRFDGMRQQQFVKTIQDLGAINNTIVLYIGPKAPLGKKAAFGTKIPAEDAYFTKVIRDAIAPYPNIHFINFNASDTSAVLPDGDFIDYVHLNIAGATEFTGLLVDSLRKQDIIR